METFYQKSFELGRMPLSYWNLFLHYSLFFILLIFFVLFGVGLYEEYQANGRVAWANGFPALLLLVLMVYFVVGQGKALRFEKYKIEQDSEEFKKAVKATCQELGWETNELEDIYFLGRKNKFLITILRKEDRVYFNALKEPEFGVQPFFNNWKTNDTIAFTHYLLASIKGEEVLKIASENLNTKQLTKKLESEWSIRSLSKRIIAYLACLFLIGMGTFGFWSSEGMYTLAFLLMIFLGGFYILIDVVLIIRKSKLFNRK